jgi:hypothetical protein
MQLMDVCHFMFETLKSYKRWKQVQFNSAEWRWNGVHEYKLITLNHGIIVVNLSMLSTTVTGLAIDAKGPISDMLVKLTKKCAKAQNQYMYITVNRIRHPRRDLFHSIPMNTTPKILWLGWRYSRKYDSSKLRLISVGLHLLISMNTFHFWPEIRQQ